MKSIDFGKTLIHFFIQMTLITARSISFFFIVLYFALPAQAQVNNKYSARSWQLKDFATDSVYGTSVSKAYAKLLLGKKSQQVIVAVIDTGLDTAHEDLKDRIWTNKEEIPGNNIDDDHNGYVDDVHGWNFLGGKNGRNIIVESYETERDFYRLSRAFKDIKDSLSVAKDRRMDYAYWQKLKGMHIKDSINRAFSITLLSSVSAKLASANNTWRTILKKDTITLADMKNCIAPDHIADSLRTNIINLYLIFHKEPNYPLNTFLAKNNENIDKEQTFLNLIIDPNSLRRNIAGDDPDNINDRDYGNNNVNVNNPYHGTHVCGIIAANRNNSLGIDGIADNVLIMPIRAIPNEDERDKDVALAIRYAVDNGARIINMSFGKLSSPQKRWVDDALQYAMYKDVLIVKAAQNQASDIDSVNQFPSPFIIGSKVKLPNFITVGASTGGPELMLAASFSNYGYHTVDLFAPGMDIYSTFPNNKYANLFGTSMATPVVTGIAALVMEYYPALSAQQVKSVLEKSVSKYPDATVYKPGTNDKITFAKLSVTGGIINAYSALKMASTTKGKRKVIKLSNH